MPKNLRLKISFLVIFRLKFEKAIIIFEITTFEFVEQQSLDWNFEKKLLPCLKSVPVKTKVESESFVQVKK